MPRKQKQTADLKELGIYRYRGKRAGRYRSLYSESNQRSLFNNTGLCMTGHEKPDLHNDVNISRSHHAAVLPSVLLCNVRAIANKIDELECVCNLNSADVVCVTETWLTDTIPDSAVSMKNYVLFRRDRPTYAGGIAAYINCDIPCRIVSTPMLVDSPTEILWIKLRPRRLPRPMSIILLGIIYHPPHAMAEDNNVLYQHVRETVDSFTLNHPDCLVYLTGDFNPASTNVSSEIFKRSCGVTQTVKVLTRDTGILDWFLTNSPKWFGDPKQLPKIGTSDHFGVLVQQTKSRAKTTNRTFFRRDTRDSRLRAFGQWITTYKWNGFFSLNSCLDKVVHFNGVIREAIDRFLPLTRTRAHQGDRPWVTPKIRAWIRNRQIFLARHGKDSQSFKQWRNKVQRAIRSCKETYYNSKVQNLKETRVGKWWKEVKDLSGVSMRESQWHSQLVDGANITSVMELCECINDFFASLTAGFTPLSPSDMSDIHVGIEAIPPPISL